MSGRRVLVVGGAGLIGGYAAIHLDSLGHDVTIAGRHAPSAPSLARLKYAYCDYLAPDFGKDELSAFDTLVFAAGNDIRQFPEGADEAEYFHRANTIGVPAFFERARDAGISRAIYVGSYYSAVVPPERVQASGYMRARLGADEGVRALSATGFDTCTLDSPYTIGHIPHGPGGSLVTEIRYLMSDVDHVAPPGGPNYMSAQSFAEAVAGAIERAEPGKNYLLGDECYTFQEHFNKLAALIGIEPNIPVSWDEHPIMPDVIHYAGKGTVVNYEPDPAVVSLLGYRRGDLPRTLAAAVEYCKANPE